MNGRAQKYRFLPLAALCLLVLLVGGGAVWLVRNFLAGAPRRTEESGAGDSHHPAAAASSCRRRHRRRLLKRRWTFPIRSPSPIRRRRTSRHRASSSASMRKAPRAAMASGSPPAKAAAICWPPGGSAYTWYAGLLKNEILERLQEEQARARRLVLGAVRVWVRRDGRIERIALAQSSGDASATRHRSALATHLPHLAGPPRRHAAADEPANRLARLKRAGLPEQINLNGIHDACQVSPNRGSASHRPAGWLARVRQDALRPRRAKRAISTSCATPSSICCRRSSSAAS